MRTKVDASEPDDNEPELLAAWVAAGFRLDDAELWRSWRFTIEQAERWKVVGVADGLTATQWKTAGVDPATVEKWKDAGISSSEAVRWNEMGFDADRAVQAKRRGLGPSDAFTQTQHQGVRQGRTLGMNVVSSSGALPARFGSGLQGDPRLVHGYIQRQWFDDDAQAWIRQGIEVTDAYTWHALGLNASEAGRFAVKGRTPGDVIREWWNTAIPFEEVADWIGAGLTATEAEQQRAQGISREHAAALRALRQQDVPVRQEGALPPQLLIPQGPPGSEVPGPPPQDEASAREAIERAFDGMLTVDDRDGSIATVDGGSNLGQCLQEAGSRHNVEPSENRGVTVDALVFVNDHIARVVYSVIVAGPLGHSPVLRGRQGKAILVEGAWRVSRDTFCLFMQTAGVQCPPREGGPGPGRIR